MSALTLKQLNTKLSNIESNIKSKRKKIADLSNSISNDEKQLDKIREQISRMKQGEIIVSEHALLRYMERHYGINLEEIKQEILTPALIAATKNLGLFGKFPTGTGYRAVIDNGVVVTIYKNRG